MRARGMIVVYPVNTSFPSPRANTIQILNTATAMAEAGNEVHLVARKSNAEEAEIFRYYGIQKPPDLHLHLVPAGKWWKSSKAQESLVLKKTVHVLAANRSRIKVVFTRDPLFARLLINMRSMFRMKVVYEAHTLFSVTARETYMPVAWSEQKEKRLHAREKFVFAKADGIVYISSSLKDFVAEKFSPKQPSAVIHDGARMPPQTSATSGREQNLICYTGQFYWWKGMSTLMESMRWVEGGKLVLFGGGYSTVKDDLALMQKVIDQYALQDRIEFRGFVPPSEVAGAVSGCSIGVLPLPNNVIANRCNSPLKLFDYMAQGIAVVASDLLTIREIIKHGVNGHLVEPGNPEALAGGINAVLQDPEYRQRLVQSALDTARSYTWSERGRHLTTFLRSI